MIDGQRKMSPLSSNNAAAAAALALPLPLQPCVLSEPSTGDLVQTRLPKLTLARLTRHFDSLRSLGD